MLKDINYVCFDLETTGLDVEKDEPIQIWLVQFDKNFEIKNKYKSLIKPQKKIKKLKDIVHFVTGIDIASLENSPQIYDIIPQIEHFFDKNTIIIGHNIMFDINILQKYTNLEYMDTIDTFNLSKAIFHFLPSYSLEVIIEILKKDYNIQIDWEYHDALTDSLSCYWLFKIFTQRLQEIINKYPIVQDCIKKSDAVYNNIFQLWEINQDNNWQKFLPWLQKEVKTNSRIVSNHKDEFANLKDKSKIYIWQTPLKQVLYNIATSNTKSILCFWSAWKLKIARSILTNLWVKNIWYLGKNFVFDPDHVNNFLSKWSFDIYEINFLIKYFSQHDKGYTILDVNMPQEYKIVNYLQKVVDKKMPDLVLWLHNNLFQFMNEWKQLKDYQILFFDRDNWYWSFSRYVNKPFDLYETIYLLEYFLYKYQIEQENSEKVFKFYNYFLVFTWILFQEITNKFKWTDKDMIEIDPILKNIDFYKTNKILWFMKENLKSLKEILQKEDFDTLKQKIKELQNILDNICLIKKNMFEENKFYYTFYRTDNVINYQEFLDCFDGLHTLFLTNFTKEKSYTTDLPKDLSNNINIKKIYDQEQLIKEIPNHSNIFVLSVDKHRSKELFEKFFQWWFDQKYSILAENITWWVGKNMFYAKRKDKKITIGWFEFLINLFAEKTFFDIIIIHYTKWPFEKQIIQDIKYYGNT